MNPAVASSQTYSADSSALKDTYLGRQQIVSLTPESAVLE